MDLFLNFDRRIQNMKGELGRENLEYNVDIWELMGEEGLEENCNDEANSVSLFQLFSGLTSFSCI